MAESFYIDDEAETRAHPASRYALRAIDAQRIEATFWRGTHREYSVVVRAGRREQSHVKRNANASAGDGVAAVAWSTDVAPFARTADGVPAVTTATHGEWLFSTYQEQCDGVVSGPMSSMTQWTLCSTTSPSTCIIAPVASACWQGPLMLVDLYETGEGDERVLWAVVERRMRDRTARMVAGVRSPAP